MTDNSLENEVVEVPQLDETLEILLLQALEEAQQRMEDGEEVVPFTSVLVGDSVYEETHTGSTEECFESARETIDQAQNVRAYAFCYDGFVQVSDDENDTSDAIIVEGGVPGEKEAVVLGLMYSEEEGGLEFSEEVHYIASTQNILADKDPVSDAE